MAALSVEERLAALEADVARLKELLATGEVQKAVPWWEKRYGIFADSPDYDEAMRLGREYRESLRPQEEDFEGEEEA